MRGEGAGTVFPSMERRDGLFQDRDPVPELGEFYRKLLEVVCGGNIYWKRQIST